MFYYILFYLFAGMERFERPFAGLESAVLPLDDRPRHVWLGAGELNPLVGKFLSIC